MRSKFGPYCCMMAVNPYLLWFSTIWCKVWLRSALCDSEGVYDVSCSSVTQFLFTSALASGLFRWTVLAPGVVFNRGDPSTRRSSIMPIHHGTLIMWLQVFKCPIYGPIIPKVTSSFVPYRKSVKLEDAADLYVRAANAFKVAKRTKGKPICWPCIAFYLEG